MQQGKIRCLCCKHSHSIISLYLSTKPLISAVRRLSRSTVKLMERESGCRVWDTMTLRGSVGPVTSWLPASGSAASPVTSDITSAIPVYTERHQHTKHHTQYPALVCRIHSSPHMCQSVCILCKHSSISQKNGLVCSRLASSKQCTCALT